MLPAPACSNCGSAAVNTYCADCGERQPSHRDFSVRGLVLDAAHEITSLDGKLVRSVIALLTKPGLLTREWFEGPEGEPAHLRHPRAHRNLGGLLAVMGPYIYVALRRVHNDNRLGAVVRTAILFMAIGQLTGVYHDVLFYTTIFLL